MPVPGMTTPEPAPVEAVSATALPFPSTTEMWVVPRETFLERPGEPAATEGAVEPLHACVRLLAHYACERIDRFRTAWFAHADLLQHRQAVGDEDPARGRWRVGEELLAAEVGTHRAPSDHAVLVEVALRDAAAVRAHVLGDRVRQDPPVEHLRTLVGEELERLREVFLDQRVPRDQAVAVRLVDGA
jgi:hypothetical protein